ncbi:hypothetical protein P4T04_10120 [Bacillus badius]|uniref:hypothetical protein n=1 Tax=Bacillus badius TaxID=1455 RepID=UPI002E1F0482|nr:hypothetical protein [Bacillus badius]
MKLRNKSAAKLFFVISLFLLLFAIYDYFTECAGCMKTDLRYTVIALFIALVLYISDKRDKANKEIKYLSKGYEGVKKDLPDEILF